MIDVKTLLRTDSFFQGIDDKGNNIKVMQKFPQSEWNDAVKFKEAGITGYEPMTAKELDTEDAQDSRFNSQEYVVEEKFDGTRALVHFMDDCCRVFSRRVSKKTGFYVENTDSVPHIRETCRPDFKGTILDGEMFIEGQPFKEVSGTLNCLWDKAVDRQIEKGFITFHAFDILFYRGIDLRRFPLLRRKFFLNVVIEEVGNPYIVEVPYYKCGSREQFYTIREMLGSSDKSRKAIDAVLKSPGTYPALNEMATYPYNKLSPKAWYELIVLTGGEGVMLKHIEGKYHHKRCWEYSKVKKFLTREMIVVGFNVPTREYTGKELHKWAYWQSVATGEMYQGNFYGDSRYIPVTRHYFNRQVGTMLLGVFITQEEFNKLPINKRGAVYDPSEFFEESFDSDYMLMEVCECSGFDDETREMFTENADSIIGTVVEVKANEVFKDSGKLRHPRYLRQRPDKNPSDCRWEEHVG